MNFTKKELRDFLESDSEETFEEFNRKKEQEKISVLLDETLEKLKYVSLASKVYVISCYIIIMVAVYFVLR